MKRKKTNKRTSSAADVEAILGIIKSFGDVTDGVATTTAHRQLNKLSQKELRKVLYQLRIVAAKVDMAIARTDKVLDTRNDMARAAMMQRR